MPLGKIYFRADGDTSIGFGHLIRSLTLSEILSPWFDCRFFSRPLTQFWQQEVEKISPLTILPDDNTHFDHFLTHLRGEETVILDNYFFTTAYQQQIKDKGSSLVCIDDLIDRRFVADRVINYGTSSAQKYDKADYTRILSGLDYALVRKEFRKGYNPIAGSVTHPPAHPTIGLCFGGADPLDLTGQYAKVLLSIPTVEKIIAITGKEIPLQSPQICHLQNLSAQEMAQALSECDKVITSASTVMIEALALGVDVAAGYYVDNQQSLYRTASAQGYIFPLGSLTESGLSQKIRSFLCADRPKHRLTLPSPSPYLPLFTELAGYRIVHYTDLTPEQHTRLLSIRNHPSVREKMDNTDPILINNHLRFVESLSNHPTKQYVAVLYDQQIIGGFSFIDIEGKKADRGIFLSAELTGQGWGTKIEALAEIYALTEQIETLTAKVKKENEPSLRFHLRNGYTPVGENDEMVFFNKQLHFAP